MGNLVPLEAILIPLRTIDGILEQIPQCLGGAREGPKYLNETEIVGGADT